MLNYTYLCMSCSHIPIGKVFIRPLVYLGLHNIIDKRRFIEIS
ncbi:hypothetical protein CSC04_0400 [Enterobacter roggenkampii]|nr:hypothetical protein CSC04_0400 [Enterobacter roggenkampii]